PGYAPSSARPGSTARPACSAPGSPHPPRSPGSGRRRIPRRKGRWGGALWALVPQRRPPVQAFLDRGLATLALRVIEASALHLFREIVLAGETFGRVVV